MDTGAVRAEAWLETLTAPRASRMKAEQKMRTRKSTVMPALITAVALSCPFYDSPAWPQSARPPANFSFFVATRDGDGNLGGLVGADARCQELAATVGAGDRPWRAYLSTAKEHGEPGVNARDRIGPGPWYNVKGELIASSIEALHSDAHHIDARTGLNERGEPARRPHDILTGSDANGRLALVDGKPATCANWTSGGDGVVAKIGHVDRMDTKSHDNKRFYHWNGSWNSEHETPNCTLAGFQSYGGGGHLYCFAADRGRQVPPMEPADPAAYTFRHGVVVNHWLGDTLVEQTATDSLLYGAPWFTEEDVEWIAAHGFDHIRVLVGGNFWVTTNPPNGYANSSGYLDEANIAHFDSLLRWARNHHLGVVLAMHGLPGYRNGIRYAEKPADSASPFTDETTRSDAAYLWWLVAQRYQNVGSQLRFELLSQPGAGSAGEIRQYNSQMLESIRRVDRKRMVYLTTRDMRVASIDDVQLSDPNTALVLSFFTPEVFTRQFDRSAPKVPFPGRVPDLSKAYGSDSPQARAVNTELTVAAVVQAVDALSSSAKAAAHGREVYIGSFGALGFNEASSAETYVRTVRQAFERNGLSWAVYDYFTGGAVRGDWMTHQYGQGEPTHIHRALFFDK